MNRSFLRTGVLGDAITAGLGLGLATGVFLGWEVFLTDAFLGIGPLYRANGVGCTGSSVIQMVVSSTENKASSWYILTKNSTGVEGHS